MLLRPQHFQQERRYLEHLVHAALGAHHGFGWGFTQLELDRDRLASGQVALARAEAIFPDGTPVVMPGEDVAPTPIDVPTDLSNERLFLCLPTLAAGQQEHFAAADSGVLHKHGLVDLDVRDNTSNAAASSTQIQVAPIRTELRFESQPLDGYTKLGIAQVVECQSNRQVVLDANYIPPTLHAQANDRLAGFLKEILGLLNHRAEELSGRVSSAQIGTAQTADFVMLQAINRFTPDIAHLAGITGTHPEALYRTLLRIAGELATFVADNKRASEYATYDHDDLRATFEPVVADIRAALGVILERRAVPIPLKEYPNLNLFAGSIGDQSLVEHARFVLAVAADMSQDQVLQQFPALVKLAAQEEIAEVVNKLLPGIPIRALSVAPQQIPYHSGSTYFELDTKAELWQGLNKTGALAIHLGRKFAGLRLELWAIRG